MQQTFYIDSEEEISSVVDRLNKSMSTDNYFVVPKRALFLQSIVNLKLLKREADKIGKRVVLVTQDEIGSSMAERSGIETRPTLEGIDAGFSIADENEDEPVGISTKQTIETEPDQDKQIRLSGVGSNDYYDSLAFQNEQLSQSVAAPKSQTRKIPVNSIVESDEEVKTPPLRESLTQNPPLRVPSQSIIPKKPTASQIFPKPSFRKPLDQAKERSLEKMFSKEASSKQSPQQPVVGNKSDGKTKKIFIGFVLLCALAFVAIAVYLFAPSAKISIVPNILKDKVDVNIIASGDEAKIDQATIPVRVIDKVESISLSNDVSGSAVAGGKKAHGVIVIYNEFSDSPQTLIATTRFESANGKVFRLAKNVIVPGTTIIGGQMKPGVINADIVADQAGSDYNLDPTDFKIPGFSGSPKYDKFYAKSTEAITGGSTDGSSAGGAVSQKDLDTAKVKTEDALKAKINDLIKGELQTGEMALPEAEKITITKSLSAAKIGDLVKTFDYTAAATIRVLVFSESDVKNVLTQSLKKDDNSANSKKEITKIEYGSAESDFDKNSLNLKVHGEVTTVPSIDVNLIKNELLGKTDDQLGAILKKYPTIKNVNIEFNPSFINRVPQYSQRVSVVIENN